MDYQHAIKKLKSCSQEHLLQNWTKLSTSQKQRLLAQIEELNLEDIQQQKTLLQMPVKHPTNTIEPFLDYAHSGNLANRETGRKLIF